MLWIANPNNPTGTFAPAEQVQALLARVPRRVIVVLDEAYHEYLPDALRVDSMRWLEHFPNLVITRTFSKAYGLAGLRVGFALAHPEICDLMNRVRQPFNVNSLAQAAAVAALRDQAFVQRSRRVNDDGMRQLTRGFERLKLDSIPSFGNFVTVRVGDAGAGLPAPAAAGRDRAAGRRLRPAGAPARDDRHWSRRTRASCRRCEAALHA